MERSHVTVTASGGGGGGGSGSGSGARLAMEQLSDVYLSPLPKSPYVRPFRFNYTQNGVAKTWDLLQVHDSVAVVVFNVTRRVLVMVRQFRPAVYFNCVSPADRGGEAEGEGELGGAPPTIDTRKYPAALGVTLEMCAGIVDKDMSLEDIAREEVLEECGYAVASGGLQRVLSYRAGVGVQGATQTLFYAEVTDDMKVDQGGGVDDELIEVVELSVAAAEAALLSPAQGVVNSPPSALFALQWFLANKAERWRKSFETTCGECREPSGPSAPC